MIVISDRKAANQLIDKKGSIYSDRPINYVTNFITHGDHLTLERQTPGWREKRSVVTRNLNPKMLDEKHFRIQEAEYEVIHRLWEHNLTRHHRAVIFMNNLLKDPGRIFDYVKLYTLSVASTIIYGKRVTSFDSTWYKEFFELMEIVCGLS